MGDLLGVNVVLHCEHEVQYLNKNLNNK
uniref:Uncharacterized protein n=1 Tax=Vitis vinifera TaxID=29760 RepID=F6HZ20_VITVI